MSTKNKPKLNGTFWLVLFLTVFASILVVDQWVLPYFAEQQAKIDNPVNSNQTTVSLGGNTLSVEVRDTDDGRALGLSGRESLPANQGMLFVFEQPGQPVFWMKDMLIPIDVIWLFEGKVVQVHTNVPPPTAENPKIETMVPQQPIDMVLEVNAGWVEENDIQVGEVVVVSL